MSISSIKNTVRNRLWGKAAGRCQYEGCNIPLWKDNLTKAEFNTSYIAHIIADKPTGPRGDKVLSKKLKSDISNLMLLCDIHHRKIDIDDVEGHSIERLRSMKRFHEQRVELLSSIMPDRQSHLLFFGANIGKHQSPLSFLEAAEAMVSENGRYPADSYAVEIGLQNSSLNDATTIFWEAEQQNLIHEFNSKVLLKTHKSGINHISVFALAPQPLLIQLGILLGEIISVDTYQRLKEPVTWKWQKGEMPVEFALKYNGKLGEKVALKLALSATITDSRIEQVLGSTCPIWSLSHPNPHNDFLRSKAHLQSFRENMRMVFDKIKAIHGEDATILIFPAMPVSAAIELGRVWMPKADLPLEVFDQNKLNGGFFSTIKIK